MRNLLCTLILFAITMVCGAQPGSLDTSFNPTDIGFDYKSGSLNNAVRSICVQADGKILIGGDFTATQDFPSSGIARLSAGGLLDFSFDYNGAKANAPVRAVALQRDGKILVGGAFTNYNGDWYFDYLARLQTNGRLDNDFNPDRAKNGGDDTGPGSDVAAIAVQADGKIVIGGGFVTYNLVPRNHVARLNADGTLDPTFIPALAVRQMIASIAVQSDGRILVAGSYYDANANVQYYINRLNRDGSVDTTFRTGSGVNNSINTIVVQTDGKILVGGNFTLFDGTPRRRLARLNSDGSLDGGFDPGSGADSVVRSLVIQSDGKVLVGGDFTSFMGAARRGLVRLNPDGTMDSSFGRGSGTDRSVYTIALGSDNKILVGGNFSSYDGVACNYLACLGPNGSLDTEFGKSRGANATVRSLALQRDNKVIVGGDFTSFNGTSRNYLARMDKDGALDTSFDTGSGADSSVYATAVQADGKILAAGRFSKFNNTPRNRIARLDPDGRLDATFNPGSGADSSIRAIAIQNDGKIVIGGHFTSFDGIGRRGVARLHPDGSLDTSFDPGSGLQGSVSSIVLQSDGRILVGGDFTSYNGTARKSIARLNPDGSLDLSFDPGSGPNNGVTAVVLQNDGKILIGGSFTAYNGSARSRIARLNGDGSLDTTFQPVKSYYSAIHSMALQGDGKILVGGQEFARLYSDGRYDASFRGSVDSIIHAIIAVDYEKVLIGGDFTYCYSDEFQTFIGRNRVARIKAGTNAITLGAVSPTSYCAGSEIIIPYTLTGIYPDLVSFQVWLSDSTGSFEEGADVNGIAEIIGTGTGTIRGVIPDYIGTGTGYKIRMVSFPGELYSPDNGQVLTIQGAPPIGITVSGDTILCAGGSVVLTSSIASGNQWYKNEEAIPEATGQGYTATTPGVYTVRAVNGGCPSLMSPGVTVSVNPIPATPAITPSGDTTLCAGGSVVLRSSAASGNQWYKDDVVISGATAQAYTATGAGKYTVRVTQDGCVGSAAPAVSVNVKPVPAKPVITQNGNTLSSSSASGNQWYLNGAVITGATGQQLVAQNPGVYTVQVSQDGCSAHSDGLNFVLTGIVDPSGWNGEVAVYPNPVPDRLFISNSRGRKLEVRLVDWTGRRLVEVRFSASSGSLPMEGLARGTYLLLVTDVKKGETITRTVVKQ